MNVLTTTHQFHFFNCFLTPWLLFPYSDVLMEPENPVVESPGIVCPICYEQIADEDLVILSECGHTVCVDCVKKWIETSCTESGSTIVRCPCDKCEGKLTHAELKV